MSHSPEATPDDATPEADAPSETRAISTSARRLIALGFTLSGAAALIYEVTWTRELSLVFSSTVYAVSAMLAAFMTGLSLGGWLGGRRADNPDADHIKDLALIEMGIGLFGILSLLVVRALPGLQFALLETLTPPPGLFFLMQMFMAFLVMLIPTTLMGATFPIVSKISMLDSGHTGRTIGGLYSLNTLGSVVGSLAAGFILVPLVGVKLTVAVAAVLNLTVSALVLYASGRKWGTRTSVMLLVVALVATWVALLSEPAVSLSFGIIGRFGSYDDYKAVVDEAPVIWQEENAYSRVVVFDDEMGAVRFLANGSLLEGANDSGDLATTSLLSLLPYAHAQDPETGAVVGLGTGFTTRSMLDLPLDRVDTIEINPAMNEASKQFVGETLESDPRWTLVTADARNHLLVSGDTFDIITSEPSWPLASAVSPLFTLEFFELVESRLNEDGVFCQWLPQYLLPREDFMMMYKTFHSVFPNSGVWIVEVDGVRSTDLFLVGVKGDGQASEADVEAKIRAQLDKIGLTNAVVRQFPDQALLAEAVSDPSIPLNTDDRPLLEFHVPWSLVNAHTAQLAGAE